VVCGRWGRACGLTLDADVDVVRRRLLRISGISIGLREGICVTCQSACFSNSMYMRQLLLLRLQVYVALRIAFAWKYSLLARAAHDAGRKAERQARGVSLPLTKALEVLDVGCAHGAVGVVGLTGSVVVVALEDFWGVWAVGFRVEWSVLCCW